MVFTDRPEVDVTQQHEVTEFVVTELEFDGVGEVHSGVDTDSAEELGVRLRDTLRSRLETGTPGILTDSGEDLSDGRLDTPAIDGSPAVSGSPAVVRRHRGT